MTWRLLRIESDLFWCPRRSSRLIRRRLLWGRFTLPGLCLLGTINLLPVLTMVPFVILILRKRNLCPKSFLFPQQPFRNKSSLWIKDFISSMRRLTSRPSRLSRIKKDLKKVMTEKPNKITFCQKINRKSTMLKRSPNQQFRMFIRPLRFLHKTTSILSFY